MIKFAPSLLSADFKKLEEEIKCVDDAGAQYLHLDIMDGHFVPNISYGPAVVKDIRSVSGMVFDVHLMISEPEKYIEEFVKAGADIITVHVETVKDKRGILQMIRDFGVKSSISVKPKTPVSEIEDVLDLCDMVLVMTVEPGFGGQSLMEDCLPKITELANIRQEKGYSYEIEIDGGVKLSNLDKVLDAGAEVIVAGSACFDRKDTRAAADAFMKAFAKFS
ncbi:MAG: ribulose-phosphate 3-epimerase [Firmicutes bacterium]|nr:ribulose-phosphate 3-epimerase [Bacillota bacterium]